jgi:segregation and condensation protein B
MTALRCRPTRFLTRPWQDTLLQSRPMPDTETPAVPPADESTLHDEAGLGFDSAVAEVPAVDSAVADDSPDADTAAEQAATDDIHALDLQDKAALLTALLFTAGERLDGPRLGEFLGLHPDNLRLLAEEVSGSLRPLGIDILGAAGGYKLVSDARWDRELTAFHRTVRKARLSRSALEILAIIAYEQPVSRTRIDELRQVNSDSTVRALLDRRLITVAGRADTPGRPFLYRTTEQFLEVFALESLADLPLRPADLGQRAAAAQTSEYGTVEDADANANEDPHSDLDS